MASSSGSKPNSPLIHEYIERLNDPLTMIKNLNLMGVLPEKTPIRFPKIVVVGDESTGKSTLISKLIGLTLPSSLKTPIVVKFELHSRENPSTDTKIFLRYEGGVDMEISEDEIGSRFQQELQTKSYLNLCVIIKQNHVPRLTIVDLPGINVIVGNEQEQDNELKRIQGFIKDYTSHEDCVFIDVISASSTSLSCLSTQLINVFDESGKHTVSVVTKIDKISRAMTNKFTRHTFTTLLGYTFVSNIETKESQLSRVIEKKYFGYNAVAKNIITVMLSILFKHNSFIVKQIEFHLEQNVNELKQSNSDIKTIGEARPTILMIATKSQDTLFKLLIARDYTPSRHDPYRVLCEHIKEFQTALMCLKLSKAPFLVDEIEMLRDQPLPSNLPKSLFFNSLVHKLVDNASTLAFKTVLNMFDYLEDLVFNVISSHAIDYKSLNSSLKQPVLNVLTKTKLGFEKKVAEILELEKAFPTTSDPSFIPAWEKYKQVTLDVSEIKTKNSVVLEGLGEVYLRHLHDDYCTEPTLQAAFDLKMLVCAYWESACKRIADRFTLSLMESLKDMVTGEMVMTIMEPFIRVGEEQNMLAAEEPMLSSDRAVLTRRINYLNEAMNDIKETRLNFQFLL